MGEQQMTDIINHIKRAKQLFNFLKEQLPESSLSKAQMRAANAHLRAAIEGLEQEKP